MIQTTLIPMRFLRSSEAAIARRLSFDDLQELDLWVGEACSINWMLRLAKGLDGRSQRIVDAVDKASGLLVPGQQLWRGGAWVADEGFAWSELTYSCCSTDRAIAEKFVGDPGWPWPDDAQDISINDGASAVPATPALARLTIGRSVRATPLAAIMEPNCDEPGLFYTTQSVYEREVMLAPAPMQVTAINDGIIEILVGAP